MRLIGFSAREPRSGKGSCANYLHENQGAVILSCATPLKPLVQEIARSYENDAPEKAYRAAWGRWWWSITPMLANMGDIETLQRGSHWFVEQTYMEYYEQLHRIVKNNHDPKFRTALQFLGTDVLRHGISGRIFSTPLDHMICQYLDTNFWVCVPDIRFDEEFDVIKNRGGQNVLVGRIYEDEDQRGPDARSRHEAETQLRDRDFDAEIQAKTLDELFNQVYNKIVLGGK